MNILHILYQSEPNISGSSTRSHDLIESQLKVGISSVVITSPFQKGFGARSVERFKGIKYVRTCLFGSQYFEVGKVFPFKKIIKFFYFFYFVLFVCSILKKRKFNIVHAHGNLFSGYAGLLASRLFGIPFVYEVRSDWVNNSNFSSPKLIKWFLSCGEKYLYSTSDHLVVISNGLHDICRPYNNNISIVGNAVNTQDVILTGVVKDCVSFGYIGSLIELEGLNYVIEAVSKLPHIRFYIAGGGVEFVRLKKLAESLSANNVIFMGLLEKSKTDSFYNLVDVVVNYRRSELVSHSVTPLKPLEAMSRRKLVVVSDVGGMKELIEDGVTGISVVSDSVNDLLLVLDGISMGLYDVNTILDNATKYLLNNKSWLANAKIYHKIYLNLSLN